MTKSILAGIIGTAIMTAVMMIASMIGMPKMSPPTMLAGMLGTPVAVGWIMHFVIGIVLAFSYTYIFSKIKIANVWVRGAVFGVIAFILAQIGMGVMGMMMPMPEMEGSMVLTAIGSFVGHIVFGMAVVKVVSGE